MHLNQAFAPVAIWLNVLVWLVYFPTSILATKDAYMSSGEYNQGQFGHYVTQVFRSSPVVAARPNFMVPFSNCDDGMKLFVAPRGKKVAQLAHESAMIFDTNGDFIWAPEEEYGNVYNFQVQNYHGEPHLFFWAGNDRVKGHGKGHYYIFNKHYEHVQTISAGHGMYADLHTFTITKNDTAICSIYHEKIHDLSDLPQRNYTYETIWDGVFQEINVETGDVLFEWRASDHINVTESFDQMYDPPTRPWNSTKDPWDWFHINMIEKDDAGNYLVSARHLRALLYIDGRDGHVIWRLGGKRSDFHDLSEGKATNFVGQHDAHWVDDKHTAITLFDNGRDWQTRVKRASRGMRIKVDLEAMTVSLDQVISHPFAMIQSESQGSYQTLPNGNILLGYGFNAVMTEFSPDGTLLCDAWWMPQGDFGSGSVQSYRNLKYHWVGLPKTPPSMVFQDQKFHVSWLGATEVWMWTLYHTSIPTGDFEVMLSFPKDGFETEFQLEEIQAIRRYVRVVAYDKHGDILGQSGTVDIGDAATLHESVADVAVVEHINAEIEQSNPHDHAALLTALPRSDRSEIVILLMIFVVLGLAIIALAILTIRLRHGFPKVRLVTSFWRQSGRRLLLFNESDDQNDYEANDGREKPRTQHIYLSSPTISMASTSSSSGSSIDVTSFLRWIPRLGSVLPAKYRPIVDRSDTENGGRDTGSDRTLGLQCESA